MSLPGTGTGCFFSWALVVTARMSNILNFSWCFLCIPAIYRCILAYLPIFFNQLSKFLRYESPSTFLWTCLSHHSFIIFLVTNTNTLLSGLYLISTPHISYGTAIYEPVSMPSRAYTSFLLERWKWRSIRYHQWVSMPSRAYTSFLQEKIKTFMALLDGVSMPSRAYTSFLRRCEYFKDFGGCYVSMPSRAYISFLHIENFALLKNEEARVNALSGLYLISTVPLQKPRFYAVSRACFCRYLSEYSDNSCFSCMLTFWTYLMRCTYPWHWIKYSTNYNRCHPIFSLSW